MRPDDSLFIFPCDPVLTFDPAHGIIQMAHDKNIINNNPNADDNAMNYLTLTLSDGAIVKLWAELGPSGIPTICIEKEE